MRVSVVKVQEKKMHIIFSVVVGALNTVILNKILVLVRDARALLRSAILLADKMVCGTQLIMFKF